MIQATALLLATLALASPAGAETVIAARTIPSHAVIGPADLSLHPGRVPGALDDPAEAIGREARVILYAGRPIRPGDIGPPALIERNQLVTIVYRRGDLEILAEGRALGRAAEGERLQVMNLASRATVTGKVTGTGAVRVASSPQK